MRGDAGTHPAVRISDVTAGYRQGAPVFTGLSAGFPAGGLVHVRGGNGAGKSTLLELYSGYLRPWTGEVQIFGVDAAAPAVRAVRRVCRTQPALYPYMTVHDHVRFASRCAGTDPGAALRRVHSLGLDPWLDHNAKSLSTGNARKLWYVMCSLGEFRTIFLDEPFNGLDTAGVATMCSDIETWARSKTVLLISHNLPPALGAPPAFVLDGGEGVAA
jgi:ABC-type multidrug transport system ATPase subunit